MNTDDLIGKMQILPAGDELTIRVGQAAKELDPYDYPGFSHQAFTTQSFISLVDAKANKFQAVIFANDKGFSAICDDSIEDRPWDRISMKFEFSTQAKEWQEILENGKVFSIKNLVDFLKRRDEKEIDNLDELLYAFKNFKFAKSIIGDFSYDDRNNYNFALKVNNTETTVRIPAVVQANIEIFKGSGFVSSMDIEIEVQEPTTSSEQPLIFLSCPTFPRQYEKAKEVEIETLRQGLPDWLIVEGQG